MGNKSGVTVIIAGKDDTGQVFDAIEKHLQNISNRASDTQTALSELGSAGAAALGAIGISLSAKAIIDGLSGVITKSLEFGNEIAKASQKTGLQVGTLSTLHYAAAITNSDFDALSIGIGRLDKNIGAAASGNRQMNGFLTSLGLNAKELTTRADGAEIAFKKFTQTLASTANPIERDTLAFNLLGRSGVQMIPTLIKIGNNWDYFKQKATEAGVQLDGQTAEALEAANEKLNDMQQRLTGAGLAMTEGFVPGMNALLDVITSGKGELDTFKEFGTLLARGLAIAVGEVYALASAYQQAVGIALEAKSALISSSGDGSDAASAGAATADAAAKKHFDDAKSLYDRGKTAHDDGINGFAPAKDAPVPPGTPGGKPFTAPPDAAEKAKIESAQKAEDAARLALAEQFAQTKAAQVKAAADVELANLEDQHKRLLISDAYYYAQKAKLQKDAIDAEIAADFEKQDAINGRIHGLAADAVKKRRAGDKAGAIEDEAKILELQKQRAELSAQIAKLTGDAAKADIVANEDAYDLEQKRLELMDEIAAKAETRRGDSVEARVKQSNDKYAVTRKVMIQGGATDQDISASDTNQASEIAGIHASGAERSFDNANSGIEAQRAAVDAAQRRGSITSLDAQRQKVELDKQEAAALQPVLEAYEKLAAGGDADATAKVTELSEKISELKTPINEVSSEILEGFDGAFKGLFDNLEEGKKGFIQFGKSIQHTLSDAVYKQSIEPLIQMAMGAHSTKTGTNANPNGVAPTAKSTIGRMLGGLIPGHKGSLPAANAGKSGSMRVTIQLVNETSTKLKVGNVQQDESKLEAKVLGIVAKDFHAGGVIKQMMQSI